MDKELESEQQRAYTYHFFFNHGLFEEIFHLKDFINSTEEYLNKELAEKSEQKAASEELNPVFNPEAQFGSIFPNILWRTTFLHSYFLLESSLDQICKNIQEAENYSLLLKDINGRGIQRASLYLRKVCGITSPFDTQYWSELQDFNKIRNLFVHADGVVEKSNNDIARIVAKYQGITLGNFGEFEALPLEISKDFTLYSLNCIESFIQSVYQNMLQVNNKNQA
jgi:hypothetical protein